MGSQATASIAKGAPLGGSADLWGAFWRDAGTDGCTQAFPEAAKRSIAERWRSLFISVTEGARILDLGCGRGAVLARAAACGIPADRLVGVDLAPTDTLGRGVLNLRGSIDLAALPFADRSFTHVVSQFGLEYAERPGAIDEAIRVCSDTLALLVHAAEGIACLHAADQLAQARWLIDSAALGDRLRDHFIQPTQATAQEIEALLTSIVRRAEVDENVTLLEGTYHAILALQDGPSPVAASNALVAGLAEHAERMGAMIAAAPDAAARAVIIGRLEAAGFAVTATELGGTGPDAFGVWVEARREGGLRNRG